MLDTDKSQDIYFFNGKDPSMFHFMERICSSHQAPDGSLWHFSSDKISQSKEKADVLTQETIYHLSLKTKERSVRERPGSPYRFILVSASAAALQQKVNMFSSFLLLTIIILYLRQTKQCFFLPSIVSFRVRLFLTSSQ